MWEDTDRAIFFVLVCRSSRNKFHRQSVLQNTSCSAVKEELITSRLIFSGRIVPAFEEFVRRQPLVRECWMLSGEIDFLLKCVAPDLKTFQAFVEKLTAALHVRNVKTSLTLRNSKDAAMVPMED